MDAMVMLGAAGLPEPGGYQAVGWLLMALAGLGVAINQLLKLVDRMKEKPPPAETYMTKAQCAVSHGETDRRLDRLECEVPEIRAEIRRMVIELDRKGEERAVAIHNRINQLVEATGEMRGELKRMSTKG